MEITKETTLKEVLDIENAQDILSKHNVPCVTCPFAKIEMEKLTIGDICKNYNIKIKGLLEDLGKLKKNKK